MAPSNSKANYKSYEAQARMVRAIVAAHPEVKWNYKDIAKYFGQSTADGIQFQFRTYKKDAEKLRTVHSSGGDVANCLPLSTLATPSKATPSRTTPTSRASTARKRSFGAKIKRSSSDDEDEASADPEDWSDRDGDETPSRRPSKHARTAAGPATASTPSRRLAASKADATIAHVSAQLGRDDSPDDSSEETATVSQSTPAEYKSLFGDARASANGNGHGHAGSLGEGLTTFSLNPYMSTTMSRSVYSDGPGRDDAYGDGEI